MIRRAAVGAVILGAGLASTAGVAMANDCSHDQGHGHGHSSSGHGTCANNLDLANASKSGGLADILGGAQTAVPVNICDIANGNAVGNGNSVSLLGL